MFQLTGNRVMPTALVDSTKPRTSSTPGCPDRLAQQGREGADVATDRALFEAPAPAHESAPG
jgi:hypothetical protein